MADFKARPTTYNGVKMRSRLEAGFAMWLDELGTGGEYEPNAFASPQGQYLPDFKIDMPILTLEGCTVYVEVKPTWDHVDHSAQKVNARIINANEPYAVLLLAVADTPSPFPVLWLPMQAGDRPWTPLVVTIMDEEKAALAFTMAARIWPDGYWKPKAGG